MPDSSVASFKGFDDPLALVDRTDLPYEQRLALLQDWRAQVARDDQGSAFLDPILAAIHALEMGAEMQDDASAETPNYFGYGKGVKHS